jgi:hypothetical protein
MQFSVPQTSPEHRRRFQPKPEMVKSSRNDSKCRIRKYGFLFVLCRLSGWQTKPQVTLKIPSLFDVCIIGTISLWGSMPLSQDVTLVIKQNDRRVQG